MQPTTAKKTPRLESLTFLRFIAAAVVVIYHFGRDTQLFKSLPVALTSGPIMVTFFFVLSGFVISVSHYNRAVCTSDFYRNRFFRIAPIYFIALIWVCAYQPTGLTTTSLALSATFLQSWIPPYPLSLNSPGWSISVEAFFYAISPALLLLINKEKKRSWISWVASALLIWMLTQSILSALLAPEFYKGFKTFSHDLINYFPASHLCSFLLGFAGGVAYSQNNLESKKIQAYGAVFFLVTLAIIGFAIQNQQSIERTLGSRIAFGSSFFALLFLPAIYFCAVGDVFLRKILATPFLVLLGEASYSLYILQKPTYIAFTKATSNIPTQSSDIKFIAYFITLTTISIICYLIIEKPLTNLLKRSKKTLLVTEENKEHQTIQQR